jgi:hypothetical protein
VLTHFLVVSLAAAPQPAGEAKSAVASCEVPGHGKLEVTVPSGWKLHGCTPTARPPAASLQLRAETGDELKLMVTAVWIDPKKALTDARLKEAAERTLAGVRAGAVETNIALQSLKGEAVKGYWFQATDKSSTNGPDDYPRMIQAVLQSGELQLVITHLFRSADAKAIDPALAALKSLRHVTK